MTTYETGTLALVTINGESVRCIAREDEWLVTGHTFFKAIAQNNSIYITDIRPLVVLDLNDVDAVLTDLNWAANATVRSLRDQRLRELRDQIEAATKPPRIDEPGLWGVVEAGLPDADRRFKFVRDNHTAWLCTASSQSHFWSDLIDPTLVREGVTE